MSLMALILAMGLGAAWLYLAYRLAQHLPFKGKGKGKGNGNGDGDGDGDGDGESAEDKAKREAQQKAAREAEQKRQQARQAAEHERKRKQAEDILNADPVLRDYTENLAKIKDDKTLTAWDRENAVAKNVPAHILQILHVAATQKDIDMDLDTKVGEVKSMFPTNDIQPVPISSVEQVTDVLPEQLMMDDDNFYGQLAQDELLVMQPYTRTVERKTLHILMDISTSMTEMMKSGMPRHSWSRGITVSLLAKAVNGEASYMLRQFAGKQYNLIKITTPEQAKALMDQLMASSANGDGTNILGALEAACKDVRAHKSPDGIADILLITDGQHLEQYGHMSVERVKAMLGNDVKLHVCAIQVESAVLKTCATSYQIFS